MSQKKNDPIFVTGSHRGTMRSIPLKSPNRTLPKPRLMHCSGVAMKVDRRRFLGYAGASLTANHRVKAPLGRAAQPLQAGLR